MWAISINPVDWVTDAAGAVVSQSVDGLLGVFSGWVTDGVRWMANWFGSYVAGLGSPDFSNSIVQQLSGLARYFALASLVATIMYAVVAGLFSGQLAATLRELPMTIILLLGWFSVWAIWVSIIESLTGYLITDGVLAAFGSQFELDTSIHPMVMILSGILMIIGLLLLAWELMFIQYLMVIGIVIGQVTIGLRPARGLRHVSSKAVMNLVSLTLMPPLSLAALAIAVAAAGDASIWDLTAMTMGGGR